MVQLGGCDDAVQIVEGPVLRNLAGGVDETVHGGAIEGRGKADALDPCGLELGDGEGFAAYGYHKVDGFGHCPTHRADGIEIAVRSALNTKVIQVVEKRGLTHAQVAALAGTSRTRITALINRNTKDISTDLMLRVLGALGVSAKITFGRAA